MNIDHSKSYALEKNLDTAIARDFGECRYLTVCTRDQRFTAVFPYGWNTDLEPCAIAHHGFLVVG